MNNVEGKANSVNFHRRDKSSSLLDMVKKNPLPSALIGLGVGLLAAGGATAASSSASSDDAQRDDATRYMSGYSVPTSQHEDHDLIGAQSLPKPREASNASEAHRPRETKRGLARWVEDYPLAVGAASVLVGAAIGLSMPGSRHEDEWMGETSDKLLEEAKKTAGEVVDIAKETASQAAAAGKEEWDRRTPSSHDVKGSVKSAAESVTSEIKEAAKNVVDKTKETAKNEAEKRNLSANSP